MKSQKIVGFHRYQIMADDDTPACIIEMTPAITDEEKQSIISQVINIKMRCTDNPPDCDCGNYGEDHHSRKCAFQKWRVSR